MPSLAFLPAEEMEEEEGEDAEEKRVQARSWEAATANSNSSL